MWNFKTDDTARDVFSPGYFDRASDMLRVGDLLFANLEIEGNAQNGLLVVAKNATGAVDVTIPGFSPEQTSSDVTSTTRQT